MAKRSPILGYNHNVRYRGLVFHVQTEDSGLLNPHLFTHLFYEGVIVSTRKLVYDAGANEEAVKALMQAQHKAVMKDLKRGAFDDKIDQYLSDKPGLEPRAGRGEGAKSDAEPARPPLAQASGASPIEIVHEGLSEPIELPVKSRGDQAVPTPSRTDTGDRTIPIMPVTAMQPPPPGEEDAPTDTSGLVGKAAASLPANAAPAARNRTSTAQKVSRTQADLARAPTQLAAKPPATGDATREAPPLIELGVEGDGEHLRAPRDTVVENAILPQALHKHERPPSHGAATLPAVKPAARPIAPPVVTRPTTQDRKRPDSDVIEVYSPPPPSAEPPPGERAERPGQYSMSRKEGAPPIREKTGRIEKITPAAPPSQPPARTRPPGTGSGPNPVVPASGGQRAVTQVRGAVQPPPVPQRTPTPAGGSRVPPSQAPGRIHATAPITNRAPSPPQVGGGVVMTRPAVIVGAPPKPAAQQPARVRKAREDEGRGFGQGLISEKSLDEVILAYLSEDAEDK